MIARKPPRCSWCGGDHTAGHGHSEFWDSSDKGAAKRIRREHGLCEDCGNTPHEGECPTKS